MATRVTHRNIHKTRTHRTTFVRNIDISARALFFGPPTRWPMLLNSHVRDWSSGRGGWTEEAAEEASIKCPAKNRAAKLFE